MKTFDMVMLLVILLAFVWACVFCWQWFIVMAAGLVIEAYRNFNLFNE